MFLKLISNCHIHVVSCCSFPPFPDVIAFGQDRKKQGIACHHPKLLVLQREDSIRVVITSANLVSKQVRFYSFGKLVTFSSNLSIIRGMIIYLAK